MAETAVNFLICKISSLAEEKLQLLSSVEQEIWYIKTKLELWKPLISRAEAASSHDDELKIWVQQVREVVYEGEDVFDEVMLRLPHDQRDGFIGGALNMYEYAVSVLTRNDLASKIREIKFKIVSIKDEQQIFRGRTNDENPSLVDAAAAETMEDLREAALLVENVELEGIDGPKQQLINLLQLAKGVTGIKVISVHGMGGLGKSTLVKQVYDEVKALDHFQCFARINISNSSKLDELLRDMIRQFYGHTNEAIPGGLQSMKTLTLKETIKTFLSERAFLLVLDDIWKIDSWEAIKHALPSVSYGRVMITTRSAEIASFCSKAFSGGHEYGLNFLSETDASILFYKRIFNASVCRVGFEELSVRFLQICEGLPLAIMAASSVLASRDQLKPEKWDLILRSLGAEIESNPYFRQLKMVLLHSLNELDTYYKSSFLYLSVFPEGYPIEYMRLLRLWMAEGFVKETEGRTSEEDAQNCFNELFNKSLIQVVDRTTDGRVKTCRIHRILLEIVIQKSRDQNFAEIFRGQYRMWPSVIRRLSIHNSLKNLPRNLKVSHLRSLLIFGLKDLLSKSFISKLFSKPLKMLNVLDLQSAPIVKFPKGVVDLIHLKYISLRGTQVEKIPTSIKNLRKLQTLDLKQTKVTKLPTEILKLQELRYLLVYRYDLNSYPQFDYKYGFKAPSHISNLQSLEKLCYVEADQSSPGSHSIVAELKSLTQLRKLNITKVRKEHGKDLSDLIQELEKLRSLSITAAGENEIIDVKDIPRLPRFLHQLYLTGHLGSAPKWISSLQNLSRLHLKWSQLKEDPLEYLEDLLHLVHLELLNAYVGDILSFKAGKFRELKFLGLDNFDKLKRVEVQGAMPHLENLIIQRCKPLDDVPSGIEGLVQLKVLEFFDMPDAFISRLRQSHPGIQHIPKVYSSKWSQNSWNEEALRGAGSIS